MNIFSGNQSFVISCRVDKYNFQYFVSPEHLISKLCGCLFAPLFIINRSDKNLQKTGSLGNEGNKPQQNELK